MPKRSNAFQQLIYSIQHNISEKSTVTESMYLVDRQTGADVEVDIVIEAVVNELPITVSIEVRNRIRAATVEWIRESIGKHATLPTNKLVLVSSSGFTKEAIKKAQENRIEALTLDEAKNHSWSEIVDDFGNNDVELAAFSLSWKNYSVNYLTFFKEGIEIVISQESLNDCIFTNSSNGESGRLFDLPGTLLKDNKIALPIMQRWIKEEKDDFIATWNVPEGSFLTDEHGNQFKLYYIKIVGSCFVKRESFKFTYNRFQNSHVAHATVNGIVSKEPKNGEITITIVEQEGKDPISTITLPLPDELGRRILVMENAEHEKT